MIADDDDDFKEGVAKPKPGPRGVAKKQSGAKSKRKRRQILKDSGKPYKIRGVFYSDFVNPCNPPQSHVTEIVMLKCFFIYPYLEIPDSEDEDVPAKKAKPTPKTTPTPSAKKTTPGKSPVSSKTRQKTKQSMKAKRETVTLTDFFGSAPIKRTLRPSSSTSTAHSRSKPQSRSGSQASSEVMVIPESPTQAEVGAEFDDATIALMLQEEEMEKAKLEVCSTKHGVKNYRKGPRYLS